MCMTKDVSNFLFIFLSYVLNLFVCTSQSNTIGERSTPPLLAALSTSSTQ